MSSDLDSIRVVRATDRWVVIDKPAGVLSVPGKGPENQACAAAWCRGAFPNCTGPVTVHRLDMDTSGLLLMALDAEAHRALSGQFEARTVGKAYAALVAGVVGAERGVIDVPMRMDPENRPRQVVDFELGKSAVTAWRRLGLEDGRTRLELLPTTGRTHQLRVHCAYTGPGGLCGAEAGPSGKGHPILGDVLYWDEASAPRLMLHATRLSFHDPDGSGVECESPAPF